MNLILDTHAPYLGLRGHTDATGTGTLAEKTATRFPLPRRIHDKRLAGKQISGTINIYKTKA